MIKEIREKIKKLEQHPIHAGNRLIRLILEEICEELEKLEKRCLPCLCGEARK